METLRQRVLNINFGYRQITARSGKGNKDRVTVLPDSLINPLQVHLARVRSIHRQDLEEGYGRVYLPHALARKYRNAGREWGWAAPAHPCARGMGTSLYGTRTIGT